MFLKLERSEKFQRVSRCAVVAWRLFRTRSVLHELFSFLSKMHWHADCFLSLHDPRSFNMYRRVSLGESSSVQEAHMCHLLSLSFSTGKKTNWSLHWKQLRGQKPNIWSFTKLRVKEWISKCSRQGVSGRLDWMIKADWGEWELHRARAYVCVRERDAWDELNVLSEWFECGMVCLRWAIWVWVILNILNVNDFEWALFAWAKWVWILGGGKRQQWRQKEQQTLLLPMDYIAEAENPVRDKWGASGRQVRRQRIQGLVGGRWGTTRGDKWETNHGGRECRV